MWIPSGVTADTVPGGAASRAGSPVARRARSGPARNPLIGGLMAVEPELLIPSMISDGGGTTAEYGSPAS